MFRALASDREFVARLRKFSVMPTLWAGGPRQRYTPANVILRPPKLEALSNKFHVPD